MWELKRKICKKEGVASDAMVLLCDDQELDDYKQWRQTGALDHDDVLIHLSKRLEVVINTSDRPSYIYCLQTFLFVCQCVLSY